jgi:hypothetical protein
MNNVRRVASSCLKTHRDLLLLLICIWLIIQKYIVDMLTIALSRVMSLVLRKLIVKLSRILISYRICTCNCSSWILNTFILIYPWNKSNIIVITMVSLLWAIAKFMISIRLWDWYTSLFFLYLSIRIEIRCVQAILVTISKWIIYYWTLIYCCIILCNSVTWTFLSQKFIDLRLNIACILGSWSLLRTQKSSTAVCL